MSRFFIRSIVALFIAVSIVPRAKADAQSTGISNAWVVGDAAGYGLAGGTLGFLGGAVAGAGGGLEGQIGAAFLGGVAGLAMGAMGGAAIASHGRDLIRSGRDVSPGYRSAMSFGLVLGGVAVGAAASSLLISPSSGPGTPIGSDEMTSTLFMLVGGVSGGILAGRLSSQLVAHRANVSPIVGSSGIGMRAGFAF
jgi:hypothetical protein